MNIRLLFATALSLACAGLAFAQPLPLAAASMMDGMSMDAGASVAAPKLQAAMRSLWHEHVVHTRDYALAVHAHDAAKAKAAEDAVVTNARAIADAVGGFYGKAAGDQMFTLLAGHWGGVKALTAADSAHDAAAQAAAMKTLNANGTEIATFLAAANPNLPEPTVASLLAGHVAHHSAQIQEIMAGDMKTEATTWTAMQAHMNVIADALAGAIAKQFPDKAA
ncbi:hypothetical protein [Dyella koreensis]|uniref:DUF305 domain-containing protein n=1 Tax=Dyella koreensis TaxID=311235 RepID=A0ABW8K4Y4_9GAMM